MQSQAKTVEEYIKELPDDRSKDIKELRNLVLKHLPEGYGENMNWGMIVYEIPLSKYPNTYNKQPLSYAAIANQKNNMSLYLMGQYCIPGSEETFREKWMKTGKKLDMGKSCIRFKNIDDLDLDLISEFISSTTPDEYIKYYEKSREK